MLTVLERKNLGLYLGQFMDTRKLKNTNEFAALYTVLDPDPKNAIHQSTLSRLRNGKANANDATLLKIAAVICNDINATTEEMWQKINTEMSVTTETNYLRLASGFTTWSAYVISLINAGYDQRIKNQMEGIEFVFSNENDPEKKNGSPYWVRSRKELEAFRTERKRFHHKYVADDLQQLLNDSVVDCALMLRPTFESMDFPKLATRPILLSRILVGHGTQMYVIRRKPVNEVAPDPNEIVPLNSAAEIAKAKSYFCKLIEDKHVRTVMIGNKTLNDVKTKLLNDEEVIKALTKPGGEDVITNIGDNEYREYIKRIKKGFGIGEPSADAQQKQTLEVLLVIGFAPLNYHIYRDLLDSNTTEAELVYTNFNLSKMVDSRASYGLYGRTEVLEDPAKLRKISHFLNSLHQFVSSYNKENLIVDMSHQLADLYYDDHRDEQETLPQDNLGKIKKMRYDLLELEYSNSSRALINFMATKKWK